MRKIIVMNKGDDLGIDFPGIDIVSPGEYLLNPEYIKQKNVRVFNLSSEYRYQTRGYYVSLLAEARGHKPIPSIKNIQDLKIPEIVKIITLDLDILIRQSLTKLKSTEFELSVYFGKNVAKIYDKLARALHQLFPVPFFRARFKKDKNWQIQGVKIIGLKDIPDHHHSYVRDFAREYFSKKRHSVSKGNYFYDLAILVNPEEENPPSNKRALKKFLYLAGKVGFTAGFITKDEYPRIAEYDALFIRETTGVNHHTYRFARRAQSEGLAVIDDPDSILRCCNKVYLAELLQSAGVPTPKTKILHSKNCLNEVADEIGFPCVLKLPDSSFSLGVMKVKNKEELKESLKKMFKTSDLVLVQEYMPSDFDWRIGFLGDEPLFACKYFMARGHWQIYNWSAGEESDKSGMAETMALEDVPPFIMRTARAGARLIGKGLYGVDLKEVKGKAYIIEVNDNPNIDAGIEDEVLRDKLYLTILKHIKKMIERKYERNKSPGK